MFVDYNYWTYIHCLLKAKSSDLFLLLSFCLFICLETVSFYVDQTGLTLTEVCLSLPSYC